MGWLRRDLRRRLPSRLQSVRSFVFRKGCALRLRWQDGMALLVCYTEAEDFVDAVIA